MMDAIDHGKGQLTLKRLWHALKWLSYAIPYGYIMWITHIPITLIIILTLALWGTWEALYRYLRHIEVWRWDK
jgi:hypothetical protein